MTTQKESPARRRDRNFRFLGKQTRSRVRKLGDADLVLLAVSELSPGNICTNYGETGRAIAAFKVRSGAVYDAKLFLLRRSVAITPSFDQFISIVPPN
jgi:hypothetical protein